MDIRIIRVDGPWLQKPVDAGQMVQQYWAAHEDGPVLSVYDGSDGSLYYYQYEWMEDAEFKPLNGDAGEKENNKVPVHVVLRGETVHHDSLIDPVRAAYESARGSWTGWDYPHDPGGIVLDGSGPQDDWDAWERQRAEELIDHVDAQRIARAERKYGEGAQDDAASAEATAASAVDYAEGGQWTRAMSSADDAASIERSYGDAPVWGAFLAAVEAAIERVEA